MPRPVPTPASRTARRAGAAGALSLGLLLSACGADSPEQSGSPDGGSASSPGQEQSAQSGSSAPSEGASSASATGTGELAGRGDYEFDHADQEIDVHYGNEVQNPAEATILVVMHGTGRTAESYRDAFADAGKGEELIILAPEFSEDAYEKSEDYQLGNLTETDDDVNEPEDTTYSMIQPMVEDYVQRIGGNQDSFSIAGHSAGGQFVHRYLAFEPDAPVDAAVSANSGWYLWPDEQQAYPYGLKDSPRPVDLQHWLSRDMLVLLGEQDTEADKNLRDTPEAMAQGANRLERGKNFVEAGREAAQGEFGWSLETVPDAGHDKAQIAPDAIEHVLQHQD